MSDNHQGRIIITFHGTYNVLSAERILLNEGMAVEAIAAPRNISTDCGICIRVTNPDEMRIRQLLEAKAIEINGIYHE